MDMPLNSINQPTFYNKLSSLVWHIPKHNVLTHCRDMNAHIGKDINNKFCLHNSANKNDKYLAEFGLKNGFVCQNTKFQKRKGKLWTYTNPNNSKVQLDYIFINKKWINSTLDCNACLSFEGVSFNHRIISAKICLSIHRNKKQAGKASQYNWFPLTNNDISYRYMVMVRNKFNALLVTPRRHTPNDKYENFVTNHIKAAAGCIQTKPKPKYRVLWESITVKEKWDNMKKYPYWIKEI